MHGNHTDPANLIINADDYGYFRCVSKGIIDLAQKGRVTATGVMANSPAFPEQAAMLKPLVQLDVGTHLNLSYGTPLTDRMREQLPHGNEVFPGKSRMAMHILRRKIDLAAVEAEWRAQILRCLEAGLTIRFLNSHEHIHMLPPLYRIATLLAEEFSIAHLRHTRPEWPGPLAAGPFIRNAAIGLLGSVTGRTGTRDAPRFIGIAQSGRISLDYLGTLLPKLKPGKAYELMCHPGHFDPDEIRDPALLDYHQWEQEYSALASEELAELYRASNIRIVRYRDLASL